MGVVRIWRITQNGNLHGGGKIMTGNELPIWCIIFFWQTHPTHDLLEHSTHAVMFARRYGFDATVALQILSKK